MNRENIRELHPCFGVKQNKGRIHLPVCPECNMECNFCDRKLNTYEKRPGVTAAILKPEEAEELVNHAKVLCPEITVVGIAGPGDTLVSDQAFQTFERIGKSHPDMIKCMSTNGLLLNKKADDIIRVGVDTLTVTVNAIDPKIQSQIMSRIIYEGKFYTGVEAAELLIKNQLEGIRKVADAGITVKVNSVLISEINKEHIKEIAKAVAECGASLYNIIPLIPQHKFQGLSAPGCEDVNKVRKDAEPYVDVFRHCQRCRADAAGIPGKKDVAGLLYKGRIQVRETFSHG